MATVVLLGICPARGADKVFTSSGEINVGETWDAVWIYNNATVVDMLGGSIDGTLSYDASKVNVYDGEIRWGILAADSSTVNVYGGTINLESLGVYPSATVNFYGGSLLVGNSPSLWDLSTVNIYGYGFDYDGQSRLTGFLLDDSPFLFRELLPADYERLNLIPEPATILLFGLGSVLIRKRM